MTPPPDLPPLIRTTRAGIEVFESVIPGRSAYNFRWRRPEAEWADGPGAVVVIVDDDLPGLDEDERDRWVVLDVNGAPPDRLKGILPVFDVARLWPEVRAVVFLDLPQADDEVALQIGLLAGFARAAGPGGRVYVLSDSFFGLGKGAVAGLAVVDAVRTGRAAGGLLAGFDVRFGFLSVNAVLPPPDDREPPPAAFSKFNVQAVWDEVHGHNPAAALPPELLEWFGRTLTTVGPARWRAFRLWADKWDGSGPERIHHWPYGGAGRSAATPDEKQAAIRTSREAAQRELGVLLPAESNGRPRYREFHWPPFPVDDRAGEPGWQFPPLRALAQPDEMAGDLHLCMWHLEHAIRQRFRSPAAGVEMALDFVPTFPIKRDYLWFNAPALAEGLYLLATGFLGEVRKIAGHDPNGPAHPFVGFAQPYAHLVGRLRFEFREVDGPADGGPGLVVVVRQLVYGCQRPEYPGRAAADTKEDDAQGRIEVYPFPRPADARRTAARVHQLFRVAGGVVSYTDPAHESVRVVIPARPVEAGRETWVVGGAE